MKSCLLVIDVQQSFYHTSYFDETFVADYLAKQNQLITACEQQGIPIVRVFHTENHDGAENPFSQASGHVYPMKGLIDFNAAHTVYKTRHSALVGTDLMIWLTQNHITHLIVSGIRTEQCCETTTRQANDFGYLVQFILDATLTFDMMQANGKTLSASDIQSRTATVLQDRFADIINTEAFIEQLHAN